MKKVLLGIFTLFAIISCSDQVDVLPEKDDITTKASETCTLSLLAQNVIDYGGRFRMVINSDKVTTSAIQINVGVRGEYSVRVPNEERPVSGFEFTCENQIFTLASGRTSWTIEVSPGIIVGDLQYFDFCNWGIILNTTSDARYNYRYTYDTNFKYFN